MAIMDEINRITGVKTGGSIEDALKNMQQGGGSGSGSGAGDAVIEEMSLDQAGLAEDPPVYTFVSARTAEQIANDFKAGKRILFHIPPTTYGNGLTLNSEDMYISAIAYAEAGSERIFVTAGADNTFPFQYLTWGITGGKVSCDYFIE